MVERFCVPTAKPRNRVVVAALRRGGAGVHRSRDARQRGHRVLRQELAQLEKPPHQP